MPDTEETLELAETSRGKMLEKQNDPIAKEKNVNIKLIDHDALKKLSDLFSAHFVPQKELSAEQAFRLPISKPTCEKPPVQPEPVSKEISCELPTINLVKDNFNKMRSLINNFDKVITIRTKVTGQNKVTWGFEHIRGAFEKDFIPFAKTLKEYFQMFDQGLAKEINEMKEVFTQMENEVDNFSIERKCFEIKVKELLLENERLLEHIVYQDILCIVMHADAAINCVVPKTGDTLAYAEMEHSYIDKYNKV
ncbi:hypothetical protein Tco_0869518 [Tanacetum coccineum]